MPTFTELEHRIHSIADAYGGKLPVEHALVWEGYVGALLEWQLLSVGDHAKLLALLGQMPAAPGLMVSLGPDGAKEVMERQGIAELAETGHG